MPLELEGGAAVSRTKTPKLGMEPLIARALEVDLDAGNVEDIAKFFEHLAKLLRKNGRVKITIE